MSVNRNKARQITQDTVRALDAGRYVNLFGEDVNLSAAVRRAVEGTVSYPPGAAVPAVAPGERLTAFEVTNETTLAAAWRLVRDGHRPAALNFASAKHPGGGFLNGAVAQEESLCRASALYACIKDDRMYAHHSRHLDPMYTDWAIYSPDVPVFKTDAGDPFPEPYLCSFVTSPAVNAGVVRERTPGRKAEVRAAIAGRIDRVLRIMAGHGHDAAVLGAWGCGVFRNDPEVVAELFREALAARFRGVFARVVFAVLDRSADRHTIRPFEERFGGG
jgi:uncharacterized protein (TIGR02452 family)